MKATYSSTCRTTVKAFLPGASATKICARYHALIDSIGSGSRPELAFTPWESGTDSKTRPYGGREAKQIRRTAVSPYTDI